MSLSASQFLQHLTSEHQRVQAVIRELSECQVAFNAHYDEFRARHDAHLDNLTGQVVALLDQLPAGWRAEIDAQAAHEREAIEQRRARLRTELIPATQAEADRLQHEGQNLVSRIRILNPELDAKEERLKEIQTRLQSELEALNRQIGEQARGLGVVTHFVAIHKADKQRARILGRLETIASSLRELRQEWARTRREIESQQADLQSRWQDKSVELARLQEELTGLDDDTRREALVWRRAASHLLDNLKTPVEGAPEGLRPGLERMIELNVQTDDYHASLAGTAGLMATLGGIQSGLTAIRRSVEGLQREQEMHSAYLKPLSFDLPPAVKSFNAQWPELARRFADEKKLAAHPQDFLAAVGPLQDQALSAAQIERAFGGYSQAIQAATRHWK